MPQRILDISDSAWAAFASVVGFFSLLAKSLIGKHRKSQLDTARESAELTDLLVKTKHEAKCSVAFILGYHNGGKLYNHQSREKFTMMYCTRGLVQKSMREYKDVPVGYLGSLLLALHERGAVEHNRISQNFDPYFVNDTRYEEVMTTEFKAGSHYAYPIYTRLTKWRLHVIPFKRERVVAFSVHFISEYSKVFGEHEKAIFEKTISQIKTSLT